MKRWVVPIVLASLLAVDLSGAAKGADIRVIDNKVSIDVESIPLGRLLQLFDKATGLTSRVPAELANRNLSVKFTGLGFDDAIQKIFEGQPLDYVVIGGQGIIVTALSQPGPNESSPTPVYNQGPPQIEQQTFIEDNSPIQPAQGFAPPPPPGVVPGFAGSPGTGMPGAVPATPFNQQQQPAMIQTPFGPIPNPRANQPVQPGQVPGQNPFGNVAPFNSNNPFGAPQQQPNPNNNVFGNTSPPLFQNPTPAK